MIPLNIQARLKTKNCIDSMAVFNKPQLSTIGPVRNYFHSYVGEKNKYVWLQTVRHCDNSDIN